MVHAKGKTDQAREWLATHTEGWTRWELGFSAAAALTCASVGTWAFIDMYFTVTRYTRPWLGYWSWTMPAIGEGFFIYLYAVWVLLTLREKGRTPARTMLAIAVMSGGVMAGSYWLNVAAARGNAGDAAAHIIIVSAFYGSLSLGKIVIKRLRVTAAERALEQALADARQYAIDLLHSEVGWHWRLSSRVPALLRRQIRTGRLSDEVCVAVKAMAAADLTSGYQGSVESWVFGSRGLALADRAAGAARKARSEVAGSTATPPPEALPAASATAPGAASEERPESTPAASEGHPGVASGRSPVAPESASGERPESTPAASGAASGEHPESTRERSSEAAGEHPGNASEERPEIAVTLTAKQSKNLTTGQLADHVTAMIAAHGISEVSKRRVQADLSVGWPRASEAYDAAMRRRLTVLSAGTSQAQGE